jgi:hypothetical protein
VIFRVPLYLGFVSFLWQLKAELGAKVAFCAPARFRNLDQAPAATQV